MVLNLDLNSPPCEGTSASVNPQVASAESSKGLFGSPIDVEEIEDEVELLSSSAAFPQVCSLSSSWFDLYYKYVDCKVRPWALHF